MVVACLCIPKLKAHKKSRWEYLPSGDLLLRSTNIFVDELTFIELWDGGSG
jgi:hypothetical protein